MLLLEPKAIKTKCLIINYLPDFAHLLGKVAIAAMNAWQPTWEANKLFTEERNMLPKVFITQISPHPYD